MTQHAIERRKYGSTDEELSILGFGGVLVMNATTKESADAVSKAFDRGINYFDVAPQYGNAQEMLGPALAPYRDNCFLACKSRDRTAEGIRAEMENSLNLLKTDHFDLYQLHGLTDVDEDVAAAFGPSGAMETVVKAREDGKIRYIGFSAHTEEAAHAAMDQFDFDSILFPFNYFTWHFGNFGHSVYKRAREKGMGILALKSLAYRRWSKPEWKSPDRPWPKCWYKPLVDADKIALALRFTLNMPVDAAIPPGHWDLFEECMRIVESGSYSAPSDDALEPLKAMADEAGPLFEAATH